MHVAYETVRDDLDKLVVYMPNIVNMIILERKNKGDITYITSKWQGKHILPDIIGQVIKVPDMAWLDIAEWYNDTYVCNWTYEPFVFKEYIKVSGKDIYSTDGEYTVITAQGEITVNFLNYPLVPAALISKINDEISKILFSLVEQNTNTLYRSLEKYVRENKSNS